MFDLADYKPIFQNEKRTVSLYHQDALNILSAFPSSSIDVIFADPPYFGNQTKKVLTRTDGHAQYFDTCKASFAFAKSLEYQFKFHLHWLRQAKRILKDSGTIWVTGTYHSIGVINVVLQELQFRLLNEIVLHKRNAPPNFSGSCFRAVTESMLWAKKGDKGRKKFNYWLMKRINGNIQMSNIWTYWAEKNPFRHPATKQAIILEKVILASSDEGDLILDPFAGSGTTGYVGECLGRKCIMIEIDQKYCEIITNRMRGTYGKYIPKAKIKE